MLPNIKKTNNDDTETELTKYSLNGLDQKFQENPYLKNNYDEVETFVSSTITRKDESLVTVLSLDGQLNQIIPFGKRFIKDNSIFYTLSLKQSDVSSNILNHDIERNYFTIGLKKRITLNGLF